MGSDAPASGFDDYRRRRTFGSLDGVRCIAIVAVIWHHSIGSDIAFFARGYLGVDLFFVLSGYLIVTLLLRERETRQRISLRDFYMRRSLRIFPVYYGLILALGLLYLIRPAFNGSDAYWSDLPFFLTYTSNWVHVATPNMSVVWSLAAEEQFYLVWPAIEKFLPQAGVWIVLALGLLLNQAINYGLLDDAWRSAFGVEPDLHILDSTFTPILLGVLLAHLLHRPAGFRLIESITAPRWSPIAWGAGLLALVAFAPSDISGWPRMAIQLLMFVWLASVVVREDHLLARVLGWWPVAWIGAISYGMYLFHMFAIHIARELIERVSVLQFNGSLFLLSLPVTILIAAVSFRFYESPFLRLKHRFAWQGKPGSDPAAHRKTPDTGSGA
ncbi:acyltransferase family protein [Mucisphaera calidilacus]|uniref:O-acetyltransferase OatA n=1 Tax=Mucisphaera calidilacus TaxID=2527982 RepID=A0A518BVK5_9BACT|nr:acyltransferase [Mucisphaera calidilacus]QDU70991.1 O-acetyltransferase OatA [Mucisphaera calidilacus]